MMEWILSACVLTAAVIGLRYALGGRIDPRLQYALWALVLVRLLIPVNFGWAPFSVGNAVPALAATTSVSVDSAAEGITVPSIQTADPAPAASPEAADPAPATTVPVSPGEEGQGLPTLSLDQGLTLLWLVGMAAVALWFAGSNLRFARQLRRSRQPVEVAGTRRPVYVTQAVESPCLFGLARPAIYLPPKILEDPEALRYAVAHETTHFRHGDPIWALLRGVCVALHWYNPLVWWGAVLSRRDGESACDEATIRTLGEGERGAYARTLLRLTCGKPSHRFTAATTMAGSPRALRERITRIAQRTRRKAGITVAVLALVAVAAGCTFPGSAPSSAVPIQREFDGEVPEAVVSLAESSLSQFIANWNNNQTKTYESYVTDAKIIGMTPVQTGVSFDNAGVDVYHLEYRLHVKGDLKHLLPAWPDAEPSLTGGVWLTEYRRWSYYAFYWEETNGETTWQLADQITSDALFHDYCGQNLDATEEECARAFAWEQYAQHHNGVSITSTFSEEVPQEVPEYVQSFLTQRIGEFQKTLAEAGSDGAITQAELTALTPVVTQEASDTDGVVVYRVDYRLQGEGNLAPLLDQGMAAETIDGATWLTPGNSPSQPYCAFRWTIRDGEQLWTWIGDATPADLQSRYGDQGASLQAQLDAFAAEMLGP